MMKKFCTFLYYKHIKAYVHFQHSMPFLFSVINQHVHTITDTIYIYIYIYVYICMCVELKIYSIIFLNLYSKLLHGEKG